MDEELGQQDKAARKVLMSVLGLNPKTPRAAYEIFKGGPSTDAKWATYGVAWERNWDECVELYETVMRTEEILNQQYEEYRKRNDAGLTDQERVRRVAVFAHQQELAGETVH